MFQSPVGVSTSKLDGLNDSVVATLFQSPIGDSTSKSQLGLLVLRLQVASFSLLAEIALLNSTLYKACYNRAKMALCGADFKICIFLLIFTSKSALNPWYY